jgi:predicted flap endonuclease-1-like 5' DNA nuclease
MPRIIDIEGIGASYAQKLKSVGIASTDALLKAAASPKDRDELSKKMGIQASTILEWANRADLFRIKGVGKQYSDLLEQAGVDTVVELSKRVPDNLHAKLLEVNKGKKFVQRPPSMKAVQNWVSQAKKLPRKLE